jgi:hypothetical protein
MHIDAAPVPVFVAQSNRNLLDGWVIFCESVTTLERHSPIWFARMPRLLRSIILVDSIPTCGFYFVDKCCCLNPWAFGERISNRQNAAVVLAAFLVHSLSSALLMSGKQRFFGRRSRQRLMLKASSRFLKRIIKESDEEDLLAALNAFESYFNHPS